MGCALNIVRRIWFLACLLGTFALLGVTVENTDSSVLLFLAIGAGVAVYFVGLWVIRSIQEGN